MKKIYLIFLFIAGINSAQNDSLNFRIYDQSALPVIPGTFRYSLFRNAEYGINYPAPLMNLVKNKGTGGFISPEYEIPWLLSVYNSVAATYLIGGNQILTGELGLEFALNNSKLSPGTSVDLPVILPRSMVFYKNAGIDFKIIYEGNLVSNFDFHVKSELFLFPISSSDYDHEYQETANNLFWELTGNVFWNLTETFKLGAGTKLCYGTYPFGKQWHLLPYIDFVKYCEL